ncbi:hypothetical protein QFZ52_002098 [Arthrobacter woluwensis]|uniref:hypothetical protein n=1 Tax=Arthrobacter woluwensis TaxID=156980 RepID=UPI002786EC3F|nr:hypothetical protein [Arthrobacter woluwensis]MDQ0709446.1 hypothetical protein [Arthrobacter woluwensis]
MGAERAAGKAWTGAVPTGPEESWIEVLRAQGQAVFSRSGLRTLLSLVAVILVFSVLAGVVLTIVLTTMLATVTGLPLNAGALAEHPETAVVVLLVEAGMLLGGGLDATFHGAQIAQGTAFSQLHATGLVMSFLLLLWWCVRGVYRRSSRREQSPWPIPAILARAFWEALFTVLVVVPALGFWSPTVDLPLTLGVTLQTRWWSMALTVFALVFLAALTGRLQWLRAPGQGLLELLVDEVRRVAVHFLVAFTVIATVIAVVALASAPPLPDVPGDGTLGPALLLADPVYLGFLAAATVVGGGIITWSSVSLPFQALVETPAPFTSGFGPEGAVEATPLLLGLWMLALVLALRPAVVLGLRRRAADEALAARDLAEGRPSGAEEGQARSWEMIRSRRRRAGRAVALPVLVTVLLVILQQTFVNAVSWFEPVMMPPSDGPAPGYSSGVSLPWYLPLFGGVFTALISAGAAWLPSILERAPRLMGLLAWRTRELAAWQEARGLTEPAGGASSAGRRAAAAASVAGSRAWDVGNGEVEIRELEYDGPVPDGPFRGRE